MDMDRLFSVEILALMIPIVAILVGGIIAVVKILIRHNERMAMIQQGIHPDSFKSDDEDDD